MSDKIGRLLPDAAARLRVRLDEAMNEIERLRQIASYLREIASYWHKMHDAQVDDIERLRAELDLVSK